VQGRFRILNLGVTKRRERKPARQRPGGIRCLVRNPERVRPRLAFSRRPPSTSYDANSQITANPFPPPPLRTNPCSGQLQGFPLVLSPARLPRSSRTSLAPSPPRSNMHANKSVPITSLSIQSVSSPHILQWSVLLEGSTGVRRRGLCTRLGKPPGGRLGSWMRMLIGGTRVEPSLARGWND
jgi:hypothetical protein